MVETGSVFRERHSQSLRVHYATRQRELGKTRQEQNLNREGIVQVLKLLIGFVNGVLPHAVHDLRRDEHDKKNRKNRQPGVSNLAE
jgi:uncharacterized metal-binding protein